VLEVVAPSLGPLAPGVDDDELVGHVEHEIALVGGPLEPEAKSLELEGQVVRTRRRVPRCASSELAKRSIIARRIVKTEVCLLRSSSANRLVGGAISPARWCRCAPSR